MILSSRSLSRSSKLRPRRRAAATVEFAIVAPLLILLLFGIIEFGRVMMALELLNNAARNGARAAVVNGATTSSIDAAVSDTLTSTSITGASTTITVNGTSADISTANTGDTIAVTVSVSTDNVTWLPRQLFMNGKTLTTTATMRRE